MDFLRAVMTRSKESKPHNPNTRTVGLRGWPEVPHVPRPERLRLGFYYLLPRMFL